MINVDVFLFSGIVNFQGCVSHNFRISHSNQSQVEMGDLILVASTFFAHQGRQLPKPLQPR